MITQLRHASLTVCVGFILTSTALAQEHIPFDWPRQSGTWVYREVPEAVIEPGQIYEGIAIELDGTAHYAGWELFYDRPPGRESAQLEIYRSPDRRYFAVGDRRDGGIIVQVAIVDTQADLGPEAITLNGGVVMGPMISPLRPQANVRIQPGIAFSPDSDVALARAYISVGEFPAVEALVWTHMSTGQIGESPSNFFEGGDFQTDIARTRSSIASGGVVTITIKRRDCGSPCEETVVEHQLPAQLLREMTYRMPLPAPRAVDSKLDDIANLPELSAPEASSQSFTDFPRQYDEIVNGPGETATMGQLRLSAGFLDPKYTARYEKQLLGLDLHGDVGTIVLAPVSGIITGNHTGPDVAVEEKWLILRDLMTGQEHLFRHIVSPLEPGKEITEGDPLGQIAEGRDGNRIVWGINRFGIWQAIDTKSDWGWAHGPASAIERQAAERGWIDPMKFIETRSDQPPLEVEHKPMLSVDTEGVSLAIEMSNIEGYFTTALGVDSEFAQDALVAAGFYSGDFAPYASDGRHVLWTPKVEAAFRAALEYARQAGLSYDLSHVDGYYDFLTAVRDHQLTHADEPTLSREYALDRAINMLLGDPYGRTRDEVRAHITGVRHGIHDVCGGAPAWIFDVHVPNPRGQTGKAIMGYLVINDQTGLLACSGLPFLH